MDGLARTAALVADDRWSRLEPVEPTKALASEEGVPGGLRQAGLPGQHVWPDPQLPPPGAQPTDERGRMGPWLTVRGARTIDEVGLALKPNSGRPAWNRSGG